MASYSISAASWASGTFGNGQVTLTTTAAHPFIPGSVLQFSGFTGNWAALNGLQFIAQSGTTGSTIVAGLYTGGASSIALANPGGYSASAGAVAGTIEPNMYIPGVSGVVFISPYGTFGSSGTGGVGTYGLTSNSEGGFSITGGITGTALAITAIPSVGNYEWVAAGSGLATTGGVSSGTIIKSQSSGTAGGIGSYVVNNSQTISSGTAMATNGNVWSSAAPGNLYAANQYYNVVSPGYTAGSYGGTLTAKGAADFSDFFSYIGTKNSALGQTDAAPWGGALANVGDHWGVFPQDANGNPSTASLASLCEKTTDYRAFDVANGITTKTLYRLNDPGEWGDSSIATINGYLSGATGTSGGTATLNVSSTIFGSLALSTGTQTAFLAGPGLPWNTTPASVNPASIPLTTSASSTYTVTFPTGVTSINLGSSGSPVQISVGNWKPAVPLGNALVNGYITTSGGSGVCASNPCLTVTGFQTSALYSAFTGTYNPAATANNLTVSGVTGALAAGQLITDGGVSITGPPLLITAGSGTTWTVTGAYYPNTITANSTIIGTLSTVNPNMTITSGVNDAGPDRRLWFGLGRTRDLSAFEQRQRCGRIIRLAGRVHAREHHWRRRDRARARADDLRSRRRDDVRGDQLPERIADRRDQSQGNLQRRKPRRDAVVDPGATVFRSRRTGGRRLFMGTAFVAIDRRRKLVWVDRQCPARDLLGFGTGRERNLLCDDAQLRHRCLCVRWHGRGEFRRVLWRRIERRTEHDHHRRPFSVDAGVRWLPDRDRAGVRQVSAELLAGAPGQPVQPGVRRPHVRGHDRSRSSLQQRHWRRSGPDRRGHRRHRVIDFDDRRPEAKRNGWDRRWVERKLVLGINILRQSWHGALVYNAAGLTGATITGYVTTAGGVSTLTVSTMVAGAIEPGLTLSGSGVTGSPTLTACTATCAYTTAGAGAGSAWTLSSNQGTIGSSGSPVTLNVAPAGGAAWPNSNVRRQTSRWLAAA